MRRKLALWERFRITSIERYKRSYARLSIAFDKYSGESQVKTISMDNAEAIQKENGVAETNEGAAIVDFKNQGGPKTGKDSSQKQEWHDKLPS
jgi:arginyl-tRNA synthetase